jgi:hypothetical protein
MPEAPATASFKLPAPEALGIHPATPAPIVLVSADAFDWTAARQQMTSLGVKSFQFDTLPDGSHRFVCNVIGNDGRQQQIEGTGAAEGDAVYLGSSIHFDGPGFGRGLFFVGVLARPGETLFTFRNKWGQVGADGKLLRFH